MTEIELLSNALNDAHDILLITHINPDGDALGSTLALYYFLKSINKNAVCVCDGSVSDRYSFLQEHLAFSPIGEQNKAFDFCVTVDCADLSRLGAAKSLYDSVRYTANIDHHITNPLFADINVVKEASSTGEILYDLLSMMGCQFGSTISMMLYISMATDTGNFTYSNTTSNCLNILAKIKDSFDFAKIARYLNRTRTIDDTKLIAKTIQNMKMYSEDQIAVSYLSLKEAADFNKPDFEGAITFLFDIDTVKIALFFRELTGNAYKVSLRSKGDIDIAALAENYGGGGHKNSAGFRVNMPANEGMEKIISEAKQLL